MIGAEPNEIDARARSHAEEIWQGYQSNETLQQSCVREILRFASANLYSRRPSIVAISFPLSKEQ